ncbi:VOC family protein [Curtobacterium sp. ISL-83]|uniref:VOC family protein n=1 Tax=Curtobacterium sp. ISL-83 TaxID=2819145 RepID=UPI001BECCFE0|nr:VOC family protein [Curtobacterium sp. ISL-83]MBT2503878.1 VOC family protein [Curtobacterium sp. ISL-83]
MTNRGALHHIELRTKDLATASEAWGWLLQELGYERYQQWAGGRSWKLGAMYLVLESAPRDGDHDRRLPGLSHLAFHAGSRDDVDRLWTTAPGHGWTPLYEDRWPWAGGPEHYAAFLENAERCKVELVASEPLR